MSSTPFSTPGSGIDGLLFRRACAQFATGVAIAAVCDATGTPHGLTINSFTSVSLTPPLVLFCIDNRAAVLSVFRDASHFSINFLNATQQHLSNRFAGRSDDRFVGVAWQPAPHGSPLVEGAITSIECAAVRFLEGGDHTILLAEVVYVDVAAGDPLVFFDSEYVRVIEEP